MATKDIQLIDLNKIKIDGGTQHRDVDPKVRDEYAELLKEEAEFPPVEVVFDGKHYWLWDGFHRYQAHIVAEADCIQAHIVDGTKRDAVWLSYGANKDHGVRRKPGDVRKILAEIHGDKAFRAKMTYPLIAEHVGISLATVERVFAELDSNPLETPQRGVISKNESGNKESQETSPQPTTRDAKPMLDKEGREVPRKLVDLFLRANELQSRSEVLSTILSDIISLHSTNDPLLRHLAFEQFKVEITNARNALRHAKPHAVCTRCGGDSKGCKLCKGAGFITKILWDVEPREFK